MINKFWQQAKQNFDKKVDVEAFKIFFIVEFNCNESY